MHVGKKAVNVLSWVPSWAPGFLFTRVWSGLWWRLFSNRIVILSRTDLHPGNIWTTILFPRKEFRVLQHHFLNPPFPSKLWLSVSSGPPVTAVAPSRDPWDETEATPASLGLTDTQPTTFNSEGRAWDRDQRSHPHQTSWSPGKTTSVKTSLESIWADPGESDMVTSESASPEFPYWGTAQGRQLKAFHGCWFSHVFTSLQKAVHEPKTSKRTGDGSSSSSVMISHTVVSGAV